VEDACRVVPTLARIEEETMRRWFLCLSLLAACVSEPVRPIQDEVWACPSLRVATSGVRYVCDGAAVSTEVERYVVGALVGAPGSAPPGAEVRVHYRGEGVGRTSAYANGAFVVDYLFPEEWLERSSSRKLELRVDGVSRGKLRLPRHGGGHFLYRVEDGELVPDPPIADEGQIELSLDYRGDRGGAVRAINFRTGAFVEQPDDEASIDLVIDGAPRDHIVVVVREPDGDPGGCYARIEGGGSEWWRPRCFCTSEERQRGECESPEDFPGEVRVTAEPVPTDAGVFMPPDAAPPE
jgi:hypothetical protein